jgi:hypothetical protein
MPKASEGALTPDASCEAEQAEFTTKASAGLCNNMPQTPLSIIILSAVSRPL